MRIAIIGCGASGLFAGGLLSQQHEVTIFDKNEKTKVALEYGIYDLVFGNFYPSQIVEILNNPRQFSDISKIYRKWFEIHIKKNKRKDYKYEKR